jgi:acetylornithine/succinyldiaminopimelate/putrescine aminotransferase
MFQQRYLFPTFDLDLEISRGEGVFLFDKKNKKYIDLSAGIGTVNIGYNHSRMRKVIAGQAKKLIFSPQLAKTKESELLLNKILDLLPKSFNTILRATTGSEAVEIAMKLASQHTKRGKFLIFKNSYHGHFFELSSFSQSFFSEINCPTYQGDKKQQKVEFDNILKQIEKELKKRIYAGFITEGMVSNAGCFYFPKNFFQVLAKLCRRYGTLLIFDEVLTGFGRTGKMFAFEHYQIAPDIICVAKGLSSGYAPIGATITKKEIAKDFVYLSTFAWSPLACRVALENLDIIKEEKLVEKSRKLGLMGLNFLQRQLKNNPKIKRIGGLGLIMAIEFNKTEDADRIFTQCLNQGIILFKRHLSNKIFIQPPLNIDEKIFKESLRVIVNSIKQRNA